MFDVGRKYRLYRENIGKKTEEDCTAFGKLDNRKWGDCCICGRRGTWLRARCARDSIPEYGRAMDDINRENTEFMRVARSKDDIRFRIVKQEVLKR